jgi:hypothetical protein
MWFIILSEKHFHNLTKQRNNFDKWSDFLTFWFSVTVSRWKEGLQQKQVVRRNYLKEKWIKGSEEERWEINGQKGEKDISWSDIPECFHWNKFCDYLGFIVSLRGVSSHFTSRIEWFLLNLDLEITDWTGIEERLRECFFAAVIEI